MVVQMLQNWPLPQRDNDILAVGEILVDLISSDYDDTGEEVAYHRYFGGSPGNIAMNLNQLGVRSKIAAAVGQDRMGDFLIEQIRKRGLAAELIQQVEHSTSMVLLNRCKSSPLPVFYRHADHHICHTQMLEEALRGSKILHFSCWPISKEPARRTIEHLLEAAARHHLLIGFDPNYHPMLWSNDEDGIAYIRSIIRKVDIVKPSEDDAERLFGPDTPERQIEKFLRLGAKLVILTRGEGGAIVSNGSESIAFESLATEVVDTTGAGDAFWSGFYAGLIDGHTIIDSVKLGLAVSAYKLKYTGAVVKLPELGWFKANYGI